MDIDTDFSLLNGRIDREKLFLVDKNEVIKNSPFLDDVAFLYNEFTEFNGLYFARVTPLPEIRIECQEDCYAKVRIELVENKYQKPVLIISNLVRSALPGTERYQILSGLMLHEQIHLFNMALGRNEQSDRYHKAAFANEANRISLINGWLQTSKNRPVAQWPFSCRTEKSFLLAWWRFCDVHEKTKQQLQQDRRHKQARQLSDQAHKLIYDLQECGQDQTAERVRDVIFKERLSLLTGSF